MSSSIATANTTTSVSAMATAATNLIASLPGARAQPPPSQQQTTSVAGTMIPTMNAQFREIHKNTWLKRLTAEGKKICVGPKKSERSWVVFCVHDDTEALLEGYAEPRQAPSHNPEWIVSLQDTLHISHALIPNSHEFEFVVTLSNEVVRFHAMSWDIMQEWVETLRSKLREMKILSPRENLYTKLPEVRAPLLPTRDPTSPLPAPPPVPAAIVPGVERVIPPSVQQQTQQSLASENNEIRNSLNNANTSSLQTVNDETITTVSSTSSSTANTTAAATTAALSGITTTTVATAVTAPVPLLTSMSNTLTQNLLNMLSDPISAYSEQLNDANSSSSSIDPEEIVTGSSSLSLAIERDLNLSDTSTEEEFIGPLLRKPSANTSDINSSFITNNSVRLDVLAAHRASADQIRNLENILQCERYIPRPQTSRSLSAGAVDKRQHISNHKVENNNKLSSTVVSNTSSKGNNITELEINSEIPTPSTSSSSTETSSKSNITIIQVSTENTNDKLTANSGECNNYEPPKLPHKNITTTIADVFKFPDAHVSVTKNIKQHEYKSNVQIIPSSSNTSSVSSSNNSNNQNNSSTIQVMGNSTSMMSGGNQYTTPAKKSQISPASGIASTTTTDEHSKITTVHVAGTDNAYGTCFTPPPVSSSSLSSASTSHTSTPKMPKRIILSANTSGVTNITVNNTKTTSEEISTAVLRKNSNASKLDEFVTSTTSSTNLNKRNNGLHYEKVFLSTTASTISTEPNVSVQSSSTSTQNVAPISPKWNSPHHRQSKLRNKEDITASPLSKSANGGMDKKVKSQNTTPKQHSEEQRHKSPTHDQPISSVHIGSPAMARRRLASPTNSKTVQTSAPRPPFVLTRGLTEAVITSRPSRRDFHFLNKLSVAKTKSSNTNANNKSSNSANNNENSCGSSLSTSATPSHTAINRTASEALEQRRRSSSTSDAQTQRHGRGSNNNDLNNRVIVGNSGGVAGVGGPLRQPPQPYRLTENILGVSSSLGNVPPHNTNSPAKRMTLREQQVMQLRREIMHPGGVRLQLRRKDCVGSIAWVDAFGAVWVAGWKQKEHPVLYNALHIGDQLLSIAGITISSATEANKIIRNTNTLFVEVLVRRIPFGRGYAIRREREGQCLGLIRDGNTATIVDVVPNSLAARHGLPPKAQSCDGTTLTFWVLTEINGRPLNLFFKDNEIRDRLNSVGRDISILVQPSDLITKLKKQLKSLRGYKDYLVQ
ncbi:uncharacterized protein ACRADG_013286 isoform 1-T2 [Cochliomyia hominivorax]